MTKRTLLMLAPAVLLSSAIAVVAQQTSPSPRPAPTGLTTSRTWTDDDLDAIMKQLDRAATTLDKLIAANEGPAAEAHADTVEHYLDEAEQFFDARKVTEAEALARRASDHADDIEDAVEDDDFGKAADHMKLLLETCETCHSKFRERAADGSFQLKKQ